MKTSTPQLGRRVFLNELTAAGLGLVLPNGLVAKSGAAVPRHPSASPRVALIDTTDLYHPPQDPGDNFDLIAAYALAEVDLKAVILDATEKFRRPPEGPRDPGFIPVLQLNSIFGRNVPCGTTPYAAMKSPDDKMLDAPAFQQFGIELLLRTLDSSTDGVEITVFGSARFCGRCVQPPTGLAPPARAENPPLRGRFIARLPGMERAAGSARLRSPAAVRPACCHLSLALPKTVPLPTADITLSGGCRTCNSSSEWIRPAPHLAYALGRSNRSDFIRAVEEDPPPAALQQICGVQHNVWETAVWLQVTGRRLVRHADGHFRIVPAKDVLTTDTVLPNELRPCRVEVRDNGAFTFQLTDQPTNFLIYDRGDPVPNERALREALPALYLSFHR